MSVYSGQTPKAPSGERSSFGQNTHEGKRPQSNSSLTTAMLQIIKYQRNLLAVDKREEL